MYKAIQSYVDQSSSSHTISFNAGDTFCILDKTNSSWWLASKTNGETGYIPCQFIKPLEKENNQDIVLQSIKRAIDAVYSSSPSGTLSAEQTGILRKLQQHEQEVIASNNKKDGIKRPAPPPPTRKTEAPTFSTIPQRSSSTKRQAPKLPGQVDSVPTSPGLVSAPAENADQPENEPEDVFASKQLDPKVPVQLGLELMQKIQSECMVPELKSKKVVESFLITIGENVPELMKVMEEIIETLPEVEITTNPHIDKLRLALANITEIKDDGQQNNWAIEDDEMKISKILNEIMEALTTAEKADCVTELTYNDCEYLAVLAVYHQMESRVSLRLLVLQILGIICSFSNSCISALMATVLPLELVQDITVHTDDVQRVCYSALVLSMLFSTGEPIPLSYYDKIDKNFVTFLIESVENGFDGDTEDQVPDIFVRLILAINLHFVVPSDNLVMNAISESRCTCLSEKVMLLINRGDDPVRINDLDEVPASVLKFFQDIFSRQDTSQSFLYTNDLFVLIDIIIRNLADLSSGAKTRTDYLDLLLNVLERSTFHESKHRSSEILSTLQRIQEEELPMEDEAMRAVAEFDKTIVERILKDRHSWID